MDALSSSGPIALIVDPQKHLYMTVTMYLYVDTNAKNASVPSNLGRQIIDRIVNNAAGLGPRYEVPRTRVFA